MATAERLNAERADLATETRERQMDTKLYTGNRAHYRNQIGLVDGIRRLAGGAAILLLLQ